MMTPPLVTLEHFERDLRASAEIRAKVSDDVFAHQLYAALCNTDIYYRDHDTPVGCSWRTAGGIVADLRDRDEDYLDFYCSGGEGYIAQEVLDALAPLGWRIIFPED